MSLKRWEGPQTPENEALRNESGDQEKQTVVWWRSTSRSDAAPHVESTPSTLSQYSRVVGSCRGISSDGSDSSSTLA